MRHCNRHLRAVLASVAILGLASPSAGAPRAVKEITLSVEELKALDRFEEHTLAKADQTFGKKLYRQARAEYDSFIRGVSAIEADSICVVAKGSLRAV